jgi:hypothetical protein
MGYCPHCRGNRGLNRSRTLSYEAGQFITVTSYHCSQCGSFVYSEVDDGEDRLKVLKKYLKILKGGKHGRA